MNSDQFREILLASFVFCHAQDAWVEPVDAALDGLNAEDALRRPLEGKGIWDIVLHLAVWNENIVERMRTGEAVRPADDDWPEPIGSEAEWESAKLRLRMSLVAIGELIRTADEDDFARSPYGYPDLICRFIHISYHLGQIVKLREVWSI
ncbi:MAG: DinB family protein [Fimbriimonadaceae bacterium]